MGLFLPWEVVSSRVTHIFRISLSRVSGQACGLVEMFQDFGHSSFLHSDCLEDDVQRLAIVL